MLAAGSASNIFSENSRTQILSYWILHFGCLGELLELFLRTFDYLNVEFSEGQVTKLLLMLLMGHVADMQQIVFWV